MLCNKWLMAQSEDNQTRILNNNGTEPIVCGWHFAYMHVLNNPLTNSHKMFTFAKKNSNLVNVS